MSPTPETDLHADALGLPDASRARVDDSADTPHSWYQWLFDHSLDGVLLTTPSGGILAANPAICELLGYSASEMRRLGRAGVVDTDDPRLAAALDERQSTGRFIGTLTFKARDGRRIPVDVSSRVFTDDEGKQLTSMFVRDATPRLQAEETLRQSEERFRLALRNSPTNVFTADVDLRYTWHYNPPRLMPNDNIIGRRDDEILPPDDAADVIALKQEVIDTGRSLRREVLVTVRNEQHLYDMTLEPIRDAAGAVTGLTAAATDITERWRHEQERAQLLQHAMEARAQAERDAEQARKARELRDRVLAIVSHDLRNPLTAIGLALEAVARETPAPRSEPLEWLIEITRPALAQMQRLIQDLVDSASIEAGQLALKRARTDVPTLLQRAARTFADRYEAAGIHLGYEVTDDLPRPELDGERILQVLGNLLSNALNVVPKGGSVFVVARPHGADILISVRDSGPGIATEDVPHLFEPYWRAPQASAGGTGLGLSIARSIVEAHGGRIWVDTTPGEGATFSFTVPAGDCC